MIGERKTLYKYVYGEGNLIMLGDEIPDESYDDINSKCKIIIKRSNIYGMTINRTNKINEFLSKEMNCKYEYGIDIHLENQKSLNLKLPSKEDVDKMESILVRAMKEY